MNEGVATFSVNLIKPTQNYVSYMCKFVQDRRLFLQYNDNVAYILLCI
jgi:hypothetical protein